MAITGTAKGIGGTTIADLYLRVKNVDVSKDAGEWHVAYHVEAYLSADKAGQGEYRVPLLEVNSFSFKSGDEPVAPFALAYADLKAKTIKTGADIRSIITSATDV
tara:strand:+ start:14 stop:328 length:315 start_codon:yes stop_codon:yes gene_type:complete